VLLSGCFLSCATVTGDVGPGPLADTDQAVKDEYRALALRNTCPEGDKRLQGTWTFVGKSQTPEFTSRFEVSKTAYTEVLEGRPDGSFLRTEITGEIRCLFSNRVLFMLDRVSPDGGFGNRSGDFFACDVLDPLDGTRERVLLICYDGWDFSPSRGLEYEYQRVPAAPSPSRK
jgi:hypothetical protein